MLAIYDANEDLIAAPLRTFHEGTRGSAHEELLYLRNNDAAKVYSDVTVAYGADVGIDSSGPRGRTGWSVKLLGGSVRPTAEEWDTATSSITFEDIEDTGYHAFWLRVRSPGGTMAQLRTGQRLTITAVETVA